MGDTQESSKIPPNGPSHHLKYYLQLMTKERCWSGETSSERLSRKVQLGCYADLSLVPFPLIKSCGLESSFSSWYRKRVTLTN